MDNQDYVRILRLLLLVVIGLLVYLVMGVFSLKNSMEIVYEAQEEQSKFIQEYMESLRKLNFLEIKQGLENMAKEVQRFMGFIEDPEIILVVYETPDNPCSERRSLIQWFLENNVNLEEYEKDNSN